ncbi:MAG: alkyl/aryl-sulfatase [Gammaproteobacteria bacterium]|nr:alkyl/aryl-sulfatase [Gammaproteobacteria bacterium]
MRYFVKTIVGRLLTALVLVSATVNAGTQVEPQQALQLLQKQDQQFARQVVQVTENVFSAVGFHGANTSMIVGTDGVIIVDTLMGPTSAATALEAFRRYSDKPVKAIIYTHSHGDHTGGASAFAVDGDPDIYAMHSFSSSTGLGDDLAPTAMLRGARQFGRALRPDEATNRGVAPVGTVDHDRGKGYLAPTVLIGEDVYKTTIAGVDIEMHSGPGETNDAMYVWLPGEKVLFAGDNFYSSFPNLYAIRGTPYRNVLTWSDSVAKMASLEPDHLVPGHTMPISGGEAATSALKDYSEAIRSVYEQTVSGINQGKSPDILAHEVQLPDHLNDKPYLVEFYGTVPHAVRAIYAGLVGWFDGNPATLNRLHPEAAAQYMAQLAGGTGKLTKKMLRALDDEEFQWALELADHLKWLEYGDRQLARETKIKALRALATREYNAPNRNYYLSYANELESGCLSDIWH